MGRQTGKNNRETERQRGKKTKRQKDTKTERCKDRTRPAWAGFKTAEEGRANTPFGVGGPRG